MNSTEHVLLASTRPAWREAMVLAFEEEVSRVGEFYGADIVLRARAFRATALVLDADSPPPTAGASEPLDWLLSAAEDFRAAFATHPIVFAKSTPDERLNAAAIKLGHATVILSTGVDASAFAWEALRAVASIRAAQSRSNDRSAATVEITVSGLTVKCDVRTAEGELISSGPLEWKMRRELSIINEEFVDYEGTPSFSGLSEVFLQRTGRRLLYNLFESPLEFARRHIGSEHAVYYRFVFDDGDLEFVPFELVATGNSGEFLRHIYPLARKLNSIEQHNDPDTSKNSLKSHKRVLFIKSDVSGSFSVPGLQFKGVDLPDLAELKHLEAELRKLKSIYDKSEIEVVRLRNGRDNIESIRRALASFSFDIIHFAGHSLRADASGQVFLVFPAQDSSRNSDAYDAEDFAQLAAENGTRIVILSSCEGTSSRTLSRMASRGVPAVVGFRWPVNDRDASIFTPALHREMRKGGAWVPLSTAFHQALIQLKERSPKRLTWFSPILMVQRSSWHDFTLEN